MRAVLLCAALVLMAAPASATVLWHVPQEGCRVCIGQWITPVVIDIYAGDIDPIQTDEQREADKLHEPEPPIPVWTELCYVVPHSTLPPVPVEPPVPTSEASTVLLVLPVLIWGLRSRSIQWLPLQQGS